MPANRLLLPLLWLAVCLAAFGCSSSGSATQSNTENGTVGAVNLPPIPDGYEARAPLPEVEALATANENFGRAYREEQAAADRTLADEVRWNHISLAIAYRRHGLALAPDETAEHQRYIAHLAALGQVESAYRERLLAEYHAKWREQPDDPRRCYLFGRVLALLGHGEAAEALFARGLEQAPEDYWLNLAQGVVAWQGERHEAAVVHLRRAARQGLARGDLSANRLLGRVYLSKEQFDDAEQQFRMVVQVAPHAELDDYELLAQSWMHLERYDEAEQLLLFDIPPQISAAGRNRQLRTLGDLYVRRHHVEGARWAYSLYLELNPDAPERQRIETALNSLSAQDRGGH